MAFCGGAVGEAAGCFEEVFGLVVGLGATGGRYAAGGGGSLSSKPGFPALQCGGVACSFEDTGDGVVDRAFGAAVDAQGA